MSQEEQLISIFDDPEDELQSEHYVAPLSLKIVACVALEIFEGDNLPDKICHPCKFQVEKSYQFRKKCEQSDFKLRHHIKFVEEECEKDLNVSQENLDVPMDSVESQGNNFQDFVTKSSSTEQIVPENSNAYSQETNSGSQPRNEEDFLGVAKVSYIQNDPEHESEDHLSITLPPDGVDKDACTLRQDQLKREIGPNEDMSDSPMENNIFIIDNEKHCLDDASAEAIINAVKDTLALQPGINPNSQFQLKINQIGGKTTEVEVTTDDGHVVVMEVMTEEALSFTSNRSTTKTDTEVATLVEDTLPDCELLKFKGDLQVFECPECSKTFSRQMQLRRHMPVHSQQRGYTCGMCEKWFPTRSALVRHERIHTGERPFQCELCTKSFTQKEILYRHMMTHTGEKPYICPHCSRGFSQKDLLRVHLKTHLDITVSSPQMHYCTLCPKSFCHASGLSRHLLYHSGKSFNCPSCDKDFSDQSSLRRHCLHMNH